jgi:hypothetical protein
MVTTVEEDVVTMKRRDAKLGPVTGVEGILEGFQYSTIEQRHGS